MKLLSTAPFYVNRPKMVMRNATVFHETDNKAPSVFVVKLFAESCLSSLPIIGERPA